MVPGAVGGVFALVSKSGAAFDDVPDPFPDVGGSRDPARCLFAPSVAFVSEYMTDWLQALLAYSVAVDSKDDAGDGGNRLQKVAGAKTAAEKFSCFRPIFPV